MTSFKYKEMDLARRLEKNGFLTKHRQSELNTLATYWYTEKGYKGKKLKEALVEFCEKNDKSFRITRDYAMISKALKASTKKALIQIDFCPAYKEELQWIADLPLGRVFQKALFVILIQKRLESMVRLGVEEGLKEPLIPLLLTSSRGFRGMVKAGRFPAKLNFDKDILFELGQKGLITPLYGGKVALDYFKDIPAGQEEAYRIKDFDTAGMVFDHWVGDKCIQMCSCGSVFKKNNNKHKYCQECQEANQREYERVYNENRRSSGSKKPKE